MLWRKRNTQHDSPCPESPGGREGGITDDIPPPASNSPCPPPPPPQPSDENALTPQPPKERPEMEHFQLLKWNACAFWSWDVMHDTCVICRNAMMSLLMQCLYHYFDYLKASKKPLGERVFPSQLRYAMWRILSTPLTPLIILPLLYGIQCH
ncbi:RING-box protein 1 [Taenia solium]|eukprot:TsM_001156800 transcript=TsM_001156800 gene=TsM_001156800